MVDSKLLSEIVSREVNKAFIENKNSLASIVMQNLNEDMSKDTIVSTMILNSIKASTQLSVQMIISILLEAGYINLDEVNELQKQNVKHQLYVVKDSETTHD